MADAVSISAKAAAMRRDYMQRGLNRNDLDENPFRQFELWFQETIDTEVVAEPNAMVLSTVSAEGQPSGRYLLLKGIEGGGFIFFTNYDSAKGRDLEANPRAAMTFGWIELERQVRIEGTVEKTSRAAVEAYFQVRPRGSRLGAWASDQSTIISGREILSLKLAEAEARFPGDVPPPQYWGGYRLVPERIEFWQGRTNRLHDRLRYRRDGENWIIERLAP